MPHNPRRRISFDAEQDVWEIVAAKPKGERGDYLNEVVRLRRNPPYRFVLPQSLDEASPRSLLQEARSEIILVGISLHGLVEHHGEALREKVAGDHVPITVIVVDPEFGKTDPVHDMLLKRLVAPEFVDEVQKQTRESTEFFRELRRLGLANHTLVRSLACRELPMCGLLVVDHNRPGARMRVNIYTNLSVGALHPFLEIDPTSEEGRGVYNVFYDYFEKLARRCRDMVDQTAPF